MTDMRPIKPAPEVETTSNRAKLMGAAVVVLGLGALGAYAFASQDSPKPANDSYEMANNQVRTTPETSQSQQMPPPVTPTTPSTKPPTPELTPLDGTPLSPQTPSTPKASSDTEQQASASTKAPTVKPEMTPPENTAPTRTSEPAATPDQSAPQQEAPAPQTNTVPQDQ